MTITPSVQVARRAGLMTAQVDQDLVVLSLASNSYLALDPIGRRIWELIETPHRVDDLSGQLSREFAGPLEQIQADVIKFLSELERERLLDVEPGQAA